ncbi:hypothetical protein EYF80_043285 [Liparis tanakae]|uniref:Uncharacterized protein n=1 Tax=Liparis tanakae TaxID=230148 RepID=A0A4Z2FZV1_9TELE|nr:hypothetical protein EYF80_043285 [Liparis tanakae]
MARKANPTSTGGDWKETKDSLLSLSVKDRRLHYGTSDFVSLEDVSVWTPTADTFPPPSNPFIAILCQSTMVNLHCSRHIGMKHMRVRVCSAAHPKAQQLHTTREHQDRRAALSQLSTRGVTSWTRRFPSTAVTSPSWRSMPSSMQTGMYPQLHTRSCGYMRNRRGAESEQVETKEHAAPPGSFLPSFLPSFSHLIDQIKLWVGAGKRLAVATAERYTIRANSVRGLQVQTACERERVSVHYTVAPRQIRNPERKLRRCVDGQEGGRSRGAVRYGRWSSFTYRITH